MNDSTAPADARTGPSRWPQRTATYIGHRTDSRHWDRYVPRPDDIFICTPPKCGTTWTQTICALLVFGQPDFDGKVAHISPWFDGNPRGLEHTLSTLEAQHHRRFIKTHTPLDGIPYQPAATYLMVYRDPRDAFMSMRHHLSNMKATRIPDSMRDSPRTGFRAWLEAQFEPGAGDERTLAAFVQHYRSFADFRHLPNFHFLHYADLKRDLPGNFARVAAILGIERSPEQLERLCSAATFEHMQANPATFAPAHGMGVWKDDGAFFHRGANQQWRAALEPEDLPPYAERIASMLPPEDVAWLEHGGQQ